MSEHLAILADLHRKGHINAGQLAEATSLVVAAHAEEASQ